MHFGIERSCGATRRTARFLAACWLAAAVAPPAWSRDDPPAADGRARSPAAIESSTTLTGKNVLDKARASVVQIRAYYGDNTEKASHGSGFVVGPRGLAITNYHVVSDLVLHPEKYRLEYRSPDDRKGRVELMAVDVLNDVALVRLADHAPPPLPLRREIPAKGDRAYSVGYPLDVGLTITEGVSNGLVEDAFDERLHYAGALNPGMSGGPALDDQGRVIGVNVSAYRFEQNVSFFVPARHAAALLDAAAAADKPMDPKDARKEVGRQLHRHAARLLERMPAELPVTAVQGVSLPTKLTPFFDCGAGGDPDSDAPVQSQGSQCAAKAGIYVARRVVTGDIGFNHRWLTTTRLGAWRFARHMQSQVPYVRSAGGWGKQDFGPYACTQRVVRNRGIDLAATICARAYRRFDGLFDLNLRVTSSHRDQQAFTSALSLTGMPFEPAMAFIERWLAAIGPAGEAKAAP